MDILYVFLFIFLLFSLFFFPMWTAKAYTLIIPLDQIMYMYHLIRILSYWLACDKASKKKNNFFSSKSFLCFFFQGGQRSQHVPVNLQLCVHCTQTKKRSNKKKKFSLPIRSFFDLFMTVVRPLDFAQNEMISCVKSVNFHENSIKSSQFRLRRSEYLRRSHKHYKTKQANMLRCKNTYNIHNMGNRIPKIIQQLLRRMSEKIKIVRYIHYVRWMFLLHSLSLFHCLYPLTLF